MFSGRALCSSIVLLFWTRIRCLKFEFTFSIHILCSQKFVDFLQMMVTAENQARDATAHLDDPDPDNMIDSTHWVDKRKGQGHCFTYIHGT